MRLFLAIVMLVAPIGFARADEPLKKAGAVRWLAYASDGKYLVATSGEPTELGFATVWEVLSGKVVFAHQEPKGIPCAAFSPDRKRLAISTFTDEAIVVDTTTWKIERKLLGHGAAAHGAAFSHDGQTLTVTSYDGYVRLWNTVDWTLRQTLENAHAGWVYGAAHSKDGNTLATCSADHTAKLWDLRSGKCLHEFKQASLIRRILFSADDRHAIYISWDSTLSIRDRETGNVVVNLNTGASSDDVAITKDGTLLAFTAGGARIARINTKPASNATQELIRLLKGWDDDRMSVRDQASKEIVALGLPALDELRKLAKESPSPEVRLRARLARAVILSPEPIFKANHPEGSVLSLSFSPDERTLATGGPDGIVRLWSIASGQETRILWQVPAASTAARSSASKRILT